MKYGIFLCLLLTTTYFGLAHAAQKMVVFETPEQELLYQALLEEYRCLKCQNQNLADSGADLAGDLRNEIQQQVLAGRSRSEIDEYLVARYGDFVLYRPPLKASTLLLWFGPFLLLLFAAWYAFNVVKASRQSIDKNASSGKQSDADVAVARSLLDD